MIEVERVNTILYSDVWDEMVRFYRDLMGFEVTLENDWFVEFAAGPHAFVSVADAGRSTVIGGDGAGLTLSWRVADVTAVRSELLGNGVDVGEIGSRWGSRVVDVFDPGGNRIEFWSDTPSSH